MILFSSPAIIMTPHDESTSVGVSLRPEIRFRRPRLDSSFARASHCSHGVICMGLKGKRPSEKAVIVCRTLEGRKCRHHGDRETVREETGRWCSSIVRAGAFDISTGSEAIVDVVLHGCDIACMRVSLLRELPSPLLALGRILLQPRGTFCRMLPHRLGAAYRQPNRTAGPYQDPAQNPRTNHHRRLKSTRRHGFGPS